MKLVGIFGGTSRKDCTLLMTQRTTKAIFQNKRLLELISFLIDTYFHGERLTTNGVSPADEFIKPSRHARLSLINIDKLFKQKGVMIDLLH